jgi:hypothetical protein
MKTIRYSLIVPVIMLLMGCPNKNDTNKSSCINEDNLATANTCLSATVITQGNPFPNPVSSGGTVKLKMKLAGVDAQMNVLNATVKTKIFSLNGQLVTQQSIGNFPTSASFQDIPIWQNVNVSAGIYLLEITADFGACGYKKICLEGNKRIEVIN